MMKSILLVVLFGMLIACQPKQETTENHKHTAASHKTEADTIKKSLPKETHAIIGDAHITIAYTAPVTKGRIIWGGLVPYNEVWVTGAHRATSIEINKAFSINGKNIPAGKYAIFTIPGEETWTFILNKNRDQHLADDYDKSDDVLRFNVTPERLTENQERLLYSIHYLSDTKAELQITWEKIRITIPLAF